MVWLVECDPNILSNTKINIAEAFYIPRNISQVYEKGCQCHLSKMQVTIFEWVDSIWATYQINKCWLYQMAKSFNNANFGF